MVDREDENEKNIHPYRKVLIKVEQKSDTVTNHIICGQKSKRFYPRRQRRT